MSPASNIERPPAVTFSTQLRSLLFLARAAAFCSRLVGRIQTGRVSVYLMYSFVTLLVLLLVARP